LSDAALSSQEGFHTGFLPVSSFYLNGEFMAAGIWLLVKGVLYKFLTCSFVTLIMLWE
jgi:hypothetical protein